MGAIAQFGVGVEILGTLGIAIILAIHGFHHGLGFLFSTQGVPARVDATRLGVELRRQLALAALVAVLAPVYIFYGFESAGDIAEETKDAGRQIPKAMRHALIWGGIASLILTGGAAARDAEARPDRGDGRRRRRPGDPRPALERDAGLPAPADHLRVLLLRHRRSRARAAGSRSRTGATARYPGSNWISRVNTAVQDAGQRAARRRRDLGAVRPARLLPAAEPATSTSGSSRIRRTRQRALRARLVRRQRHLPLVPPDGDRRDHRALPRLGAGGRVPAREVGLAGVDHRRALPRADADQRRRTRAGLSSGRALLQPRLDHARRDGA